MKNMKKQRLEDQILKDSASGLLARRSRGAT